MISAPPSTEHLVLTTEVVASVALNVICGVLSLVAPVGAVTLTVGPTVSTVNVTDSVVL